MKRICFLAVSLILCGLLFGCGGIDKAAGPKSAVESYYKALNANDFDGMVNCCDSATANTLKGSMDLLSALLSTTGNSEVNVRDLVAKLYPSIAAAASSQNVTYKFTPKDYKVEFDGDTRATIRYTVDVEINNAGNVQKMSQAQENAVIKEGNDWKIDLSSQLGNAFGSAFNLAGKLFG